MRSGGAEKRSEARMSIRRPPGKRNEKPRFEFPKNSINTDKFTMFFDKKLQIYRIDIYRVTLKYPL